MEAVGENAGYPQGLKISKKIQRAIARSESRKTPDERQLIKEIDEAYKEMTTTFSHFECATDPELIEYCIYKYKADQIKYDYLIRCIKKFYCDQSS